MTTRRSNGPNLTTSNTVPCWLVAVALTLLAPSCTLETRDVTSLESAGSARGSVDALNPNAGSAGSDPVGQDPSASPGEGDSPGPSLDSPAVAGGGLCVADAGCQCNDEVQSCDLLPPCDGGPECGSVGSCTGCLIGGECIAADTANPRNACQVCDPPRDPSEWSSADGASCDDGAFCTDDFCGSCPRSWGVAVPVQGVDSAESDFQGTMTADLLRICFASGRPGGVGGTDLWCASRNSPSAPFGSAVNQTSVNATSNDREPTLSGDGQELIFTSNRAGGAGGFDLYRAQFVPAAGAFGTPEPLSGINTTLSELGPDLAKDGLALYYYATASTPGGPDIFVATRASRNGSFGPGVAVTGLATTVGEREPGPCPDQSFMTFCADIDGAFVLSGAARLPGGGFGPQSRLEVGLPPGMGGCGPTVLSDGSLLIHSGPPDGLYIAPPLR